jgi:regulatory protein YycH of two-component signal transduction system YycFG
MAVVMTMVMTVVMVVIQKPMPQFSVRFHNIDNKRKKEGKKKREGKEKTKSTAELYFKPYKLRQEE